MKETYRNCRGSDGTVAFLQLSNPNSRGGGGGCYGDAGPLIYIYIYIYIYIWRCLFCIRRKEYEEMGYGDKVSYTGAEFLIVFVAFPTARAN